MPVFAQNLTNSSNDPEISFPTGGLNSVQELDDQFDLQLQQYAEFPNENLKITFLDILEDSRCATDVTCVWQGKASLSFSISQVLKTELILNTFDKNTVTIFGKYQVELIDVKPYPTSTVQINHDDYIAVLKISKIIQSDRSSLMKQLKSGILINDIQCKDDMHVLTKRPNDKIACVHGSTAEKLGWKIINPVVANKSVFEIAKNDVLYDVNYSIRGGLIKDMVFDVSTNSLLIKIDSSAVGNIIMDIPRDLLDATMDYCPPRMSDPSDDTFFVLLDGEEIMYDEISTTPENRTLKIHFLEDTSIMEVIATCLI